MQWVIIPQTKLSFSVSENAKFQEWNIRKSLPTTIVFLYNLCQFWWLMIQKNASLEEIRSRSSKLWKTLCKEMFLVFSASRWGCNCTTVYPKRQIDHLQIMDSILIFPDMFLIFPAGLLRFPIKTSVGDSYVYVNMIPFFTRPKGLWISFVRIFRPRYAVAGRTTGVELGSHGLHRFKAVTCLSYYVPISSITILTSVWKLQWHICDCCMLHSYVWWFFEEGLLYTFVLPLNSRLSATVEVQASELFWKRKTMKNHVAQKLQKKNRLWNHLLMIITRKCPKRLKNQKIGVFFAKCADHLGDAADVYIRFSFKKWVETNSGHFTHCCVILKGERWST